jgi:pyruvate/2-oxoglutarate dehydrogenase complex dihydrolipoamide acyltransferase (E2) component
MTDVLLPQDLWDEDKSGSIVLWLYKDGSTVRKDDVIAEILVEKVTMELTAPASGVLRIKVPIEVEIRKGDLLAVIEDA